MPDTNEQRDPVKQAREYLRVMPLHFSESDRRLIETLCDEVDRLRGLVRHMNLPQGE